MKTLEKNPVMSIGVVNITTGKTCYDWSIYENPGLEAYLTDLGFLIFGSMGSFGVGDSFDLVGDQSRRSLGKRGSVVDAKSCTDREEFILWLKSHGYGYTPIRAFTSRSKHNRKLTTSFVLK